MSRNLAVESEIQPKRHGHGSGLLVRGAHVLITPGIWVLAKERGPRFHPDGQAEYGETLRTLPIIIFTKSPRCPAELEGDDKEASDTGIWMSPSPGV
jgi:hypothetical protein